MTTKKLTVAEKYRQLKAQTEAAGMTVKEVNGKIVVTRNKKNNGFIRRRKKEKLSKKTRIIWI
jgi:hypothetical protein